jgi:hypothetical protein
MKKMSKTLTCSLCGCELSEEEVYTFNGNTLCEDCHMEETHPVKVCNPLPVMAAKKMGASQVDPTDVLDELQKALYAYVVDNKKATPQQLCSQFNLTEVKLNNQLAVLRHLELVKGKKIQNKHYIVPFTA